MRKAFGLLAVLLVLCTASVIWCVATVYAPHDQVQFKQTVLAGDPAAAEGLTVQTHATYTNHLFWDSTTQMQKDSLKTQTDYRFYHSKQSEESDPSYRGVEIFSDVGSSGSDFMDIPEDQRSGLELAYQELYENATPGVEASKTIMLSDYCDYYPLSGFIDVEGMSLDFNIWSENSAEGNAVSEKMESFFRIPVLPTEQVTISLEKDSSGYVYSSGLSNNGEGDQFSFYTQGVITPQTCFFIFNNRSQKGQIMDTSLIPGGYGIYALDYISGEVTQFKDGFTRRMENGSLQLDSLRMAFPIDPVEEVLQLCKWSDDQTLLLFTKYKNDYFLTIIAIDSMQQIQRLKLHTETNSETYGFAVLENSDFVVTVINKQVSVLVPNGDGTFRIDMQTQNTLSNLYVPWSVDGNAMAYKDGKLAFATEDYDKSSGMRNSVSYDIVILNASGMQLYANYQSSLQNNHFENYNSSEAVRLTYSQSPINVSWQ